MVVVAAAAAAAARVLVHHGGAQGAVVGAAAVVPVEVGAASVRLRKREREISVPIQASMISIRFPRRVIAPLNHIEKICISLALVP